MPQCLAVEPQSSTKPRAGGRRLRSVASRPRPVGDPRRQLALDIGVLDQPVLADDLGLMVVPGLLTVQIYLHARRVLDTEDSRPTGFRRREPLAHIGVASARSMSLSTRDMYSWVTPTSTRLGRVSRCPAAYLDRMTPAAERLAAVSLESRPALDLIAAYGRHRSVLLYVDPPDLDSTRDRNYRTR